LTALEKRLQEAGVEPDSLHRTDLPRGQDELDYEVGRLYNELGRDDEFREKMEEQLKVHGQWFVEIRDFLLKLESTGTSRPSGTRPCRS
jgi:hypothetical protein